MKSLTIRTTCLLMLLVLTTSLHAQNTSDIVDITPRFTGCWGQGEKATHNADGTITFQSVTWGGLAAWLDTDWTEYSGLVFELTAPSSCDLQILVQYSDNTWGKSYVSAGAQQVAIELDDNRKNHVYQVALQTNKPATLVIRRIYLTLAKLPDYGERAGMLKINELMQSNIDCILDDLNDFPDSWVELYNSGATPVNLGRYKIGLTDNAAEAWRLPQQTLLPQGFVLVWCDKVGSKLHTPFRLDSGKGAAVYLFFDDQLDGQVTGLKKQPAPNIAYGRQTDGSDRWGYQYQPTPGAANGGVLCKDILGEPVFSEKGRVVTSQQSLSLVLSLPEGSPEGTVIRYTLDGTEPVATSPVYTTPLAITTTQTVRAKLFCDGWLSPRSTTHSYLFFPRQQTLPVVSLVTDNRYWYDSKLGIIANNSSEHRVDWRRPVNIEYFESPDKKSQINQLGEVRVQGGASRGSKLKSLVIYANKRFGTKRLTYEFFPDQRPGVTDFKSLVLRNAGNDFDYLYMRDAVIQRTMASHVDLDWQAWRPAIVYMNGVYKGMLNIRERANEDNIYTNYDGLEDIDLFENWNELKEGDWKNLDEFKAFYKQGGHTLAEYEQWMDVSEFMNLMLMNLYYNNQDFPGNNIVMWRPRAAGGRWRFVAKDTDFGLGLYGSSPDYKTLQWLYNPHYDSGRDWGANSEDATLLFRRLMADADSRRQFFDRAAVYMGDFMNEQGTRAFWDPMYEQIKYEYTYHKQQNQGWINYANELNTARQWVARRTNYFYQQLADYYQLGTPTVLTVNKELETETRSGLRVSINDIPLSEGMFDGKFFAQRELRLQAETTGGLQVTGWKLVQQNQNGTQTTTTQSGSLCSLTMPACKSLTINAVVDQTGIADKTSHRSWTYSLLGDRLVVSHVDAGSQVSIYDLRGVLLQQAVADGGDIRLTLPSRGLYLLKIGKESAKLRY